MCKVAAKRFFIICELKIPFTDSDDDLLGFIGWVEVSGSAYQQYTAYRDLEDSCPPYETLVDGRLANPIPSIPDSLAISVKFEVLAGDPTPYIKWVEPNMPVAARVTVGATPSFWHAAAGLLAGPNYSIKGNHNRADSGPLISGVRPQRTQRGDV